MKIRLHINEDRLRFKTNVRVTNPIDFAAAKLKVYQSIHKLPTQLHLTFRKSYKVQIKVHKKRFKAQCTNSGTLPLADDKIVCYGYMGAPVRYCDWHRAKDLWFNHQPERAFNYIYTSYRNINVQDAFSDYRFYLKKKQDPIWNVLCYQFNMSVNHIARQKWIENWPDICNSLFLYFHQNIFVKKKFTPNMLDAISRNDILYLFLLFFDRYARLATRHLITASRHPNTIAYEKLLETVHESELYDLYNLVDEITLEDTLDESRQSVQSFLQTIEWKTDKLKSITVE